MHFREIQRLHCEKQQLHNEFTNQISRYEDRLTELHSVIAELRRRLEHSEANIIHEVEEFEENDHDEDVDEDENEDEAEQEQQHDKQVDNNNDGLIIKSKSDEKSIKSKFPPINTANHNHANTNNQSAVNYNEFGENTHDDNSDTSVDVMMDGDDDDDDDDDDNDGDDVNAPVEHIHHKPIDIVRQYHHQPKSMASNYFMLQTTNLIYDQLNHSHGLSYPEKNMEDMSKNDNHDLCIKYETMLSNMQAKLTCIMEERDLLMNRLSELTLATSNNNNIQSLSNTTTTTSQPSTVTITEDLSSLSLTTQTTTVASSISRPIMGLNHRSVQMKFNGNNNLSYSMPNTTHHPPMSSTTTTEVLMSKQQTNAEQNATDQLHKIATNKIMSV
ncbi:unnamed protein product [Schistosoma turkestanicum]|nr:unnamed protein product [Schistosoma turkestanicum]